MVALRRKAPASRPTTRKARGSGHERRGEILAAAKDMFSREGFRTVTTRALAQRVGLSQTGLYVYFKNKEDILAAIRAETFKALSAEFERAAAGGGRIHDRLKRLMRAYVDFGLSHPIEYQLTFTIAPEVLAPQARKAERNERGRDAGAQSFLVFQKALAGLLASGEFGTHDPQITAEMLWFAGHGTVSLLITRPHFPWSRRERLIETMLSVLINGLSSTRAD